MDYLKKANELYSFDGKMDMDEYNSLMYFYLTQHHKQIEKNKKKSQKIKSKTSS